MNTCIHMEQPLCSIWQVFIVHCGKVPVLLFLSSPLLWCYLHRSLWSCWSLKSMEWTGGSVWGTQKHWWLFQMWVTYSGRGSADSSLLQSVPPRITASYPRRQVTGMWYVQALKHVKVHLWCIKKVQLIDCVWTFLGNVAKSIAYFSFNFMRFRITNLTSGTHLAMMPKWTLENRWVMLVNLIPEENIVRCQPLQSYFIYREQGLKVYHIFKSLLPLHSLSSHCCGCCCWEAWESEATLQCRHSNNLGPSDQLVCAWVWVAEPGASHSHGVIQEARGWMAMT